MFFDGRFKRPSGGSLLQTRTSVGIFFQIVYFHFTDETTTTETKQGIE